jgi:hypothetical protein
VTGLYSPSNDDAAAELNAKNISDVQPMTSGNVLQWSAQSSSPSDTPRLIKLESAATSAPTDALKAIAQAAIILIQRPDTRLDLTDDEIGGMISELETADVLSASDVQSLTMLATVQISRADQLGWPEVAAIDIKWARD